MKVESVLQSDIDDTYRWIKTTFERYLSKTPIVQDASDLKLCHYEAWFPQYR